MKRMGGPLLACGLSLLAVCSWGQVDWDGQARSGTSLGAAIRASEPPPDVSAAPVGNRQAFSEGCSPTDMQAAPEWAQVQGLVGDMVLHIVKANSLDLQLTQPALLWPNPEPSAQMLNGKLIMVYSGLLDDVQNDSELAWIMAHELAHAALRHSDELEALSKKLEQSVPDRKKRLALLNARRRAMELEADKLGQTYVVLAGYSREGMVTAIKRRMQDDPDGPFDAQTSIHPTLQMRLDENQKNQAALDVLVPAAKALAGLAQIKQLLAQLEAHCGR